MQKHGVTLIELLVVVTLIALLSSMLFIYPNHEDAQEQIDLAAAQISSALKQTRKLALETKNTYAVTFNIENAGDSSVFKNYSQFSDAAPNGRHWIGVIGPDTSSFSKAVNEPPIPVYNKSAKRYRESFIYQVQESMVNKIYLPPGTRILAIGDTDVGHRHSKGYGDKGSTYPRPWFGYFDGEKLHPWGGYDPKIDKAYRDSHSAINSCTTGIMFEGLDRIIPYNATLDVCVNPSPTHGRIFDGLNNPESEDSGSNKLRTITGKPRPIIDGSAMEYAFVFAGNGGVQFYVRSRSQWFGGYRDSSNIISHNVGHHGGYYITVARDIDPEDKLYFEQNPTTKQPDYTKFRTVEDAFDSIWPFRRIHIHKRSGTITVRNTYHEDAYLEPKHLLQQAPYPEKVIPVH